MCDGGVVSRCDGREHGNPTQPSPPPQAPPRKAQRVCQEFENKQLVHLLSHIYCSNIARKQADTRDFSRSCACSPSASDSLSPIMDSFPDFASIFRHPTARVDGMSSPSYFTRASIAVYLAAQSRTPPSPCS